MTKFYALGNIFFANNTCVNHSTFQLVILCALRVNVIWLKCMPTRNTLAKGSLHEV